MFDYLQKYNNLPKKLRDKVSTPSVLASIDSLEKKHGVYLAAVVMKVMVKEIGINDLIRYFTLEFKLDENKSRALAQELKKEIFAGLGDYLALNEAVRPQETKIAERLANHHTLTAGRYYTQRHEPKPRAQGIQGAAVKPEPPSRGSSPVFAPEDEKEIKDLVKKVNGYFNKPELDNNIELKLDNIIKEIKINFGSELLAGRFRYILRTYLRGIRDKIDIKEALMKSIDLGGLGFDAELADNILATVGKDSQKLGEKIFIKPPVKISLPEDKIKKDEATPRLSKSAGVRDVPYDFASLKNKGRDEALPRLYQLDLTHELPPPAPRTVSRKAEEQVKTPNKIKEPLFSLKLEGKTLEPEMAEKISFAPRMPQTRLSAQSSGKIKMEDIKFEPKIIGPIDELRYMNLINFRRLNKDPFLSVKNIKEKIDLLDEEYSKRIEGIKAWRISPLNRLYLEMGSESISSKKAIDAIIEERKAAGKEYLTAKEVEAIIELNKELRF